MKRIYISTLLFCSTVMCFAQRQDCKVVISGPRSVAISYGGRLFNVLGDIDTSDGLIYRIEQKPTSTVQNVFIWVYTNFDDQENEYGKYYSLKGYRVEFVPDGSRVEILPGSNISFWGSQKYNNGRITFNVKKIVGFPLFKKIQELSFEETVKVNHK